MAAWITFWAFVAVVSVAGTVTSAMTKKAKLDLIRHAIDKGQTIDQALIDKLLPAKTNKPPQIGGAAAFRFLGVMSLATGIGLPILGYFVREVDKMAFPGLQGVGALLICISMGWFAAARLAQKDSASSDKNA